MITDTIRRIPLVLRFGGNVCWEGARKPRPTSPPTIPYCAEAITPEWLSAVLCEGYPDAAVSRIDVTGGHDGSSSRRALTVWYNAAGTAAGLPTRLFTKTTPGFRQRLTMVRTGKLANETGFYQSVRPMLDIEATEALYCSFDPSTGRSLILFEDLVQAKDAKFLNPFTKIERHQAEDMAGVMAGYHGPMWNSPALRSWPWLQSTLGYQTTINRVIAFEHCSYTGMERARSVLPAEIADRGQELWQAYMRSLELNSRAPLTLLHWDMHIGNWYMTGAGRMGLSDWGMVKGQWASDYSYAISSALTIDDRREWERELLDGYLDELHKRGAPRLSFDEAWLTYRQQMLHGFFFWVMTIGAGPLQANMQPDEISLANIERMGQALVDLDTVKALDE